MGVDVAEQPWVVAQEMRHLIVDLHSPEQDRLESQAPYRSAMEFIDYESLERRAFALIEAHESKPKPELKQEYEDNARTALFEALTASGHLSRVELSGTLEEINNSVLNRLLNGYDFDLPDHELKRRFKEICEELVVQDVHSQIIVGLLPPDTEVGTESAYVVGMSDEAARNIGYRSYNRKGMTRSTGLRLNADGSVTRVIEQVSYSNSSAHESILRLHTEGVAISREHEADIDLLGHQLIYSLSDMADGVIGIQRRIDAYQGGGVRFGEIPTETTPDYDSLRIQSKLKEAMVGQFIDRLADFEKALDIALSNNEITRQQWSDKYLQEVRDIVRTICVLMPEYTKDALGEAVVKDYQRAHDLMADGDSSGAAAAVSGASGNEQAVTICGGSAGEAPSVGQAPGDTMQQRLEKAAGKQWCKCPFCKVAVYIDPCAKDIDCWSCEASVRDGRVTSKGNGGKKRTEAALTTSEVQPPSPRKTSEKLAGFVLRDQIVLGGTKQVAVHEVTGQELDEEQTKALLQGSYDLIV